MNLNREMYLICGLDELRESTCYGWESTINNRLVQCLLIYHQDGVYSYLNRCPHTGVNLDWMPHQFLDSRNEFVQCATHGALFMIKDGLCIHGPCLGKKLQQLENVIIDNNIYLFL